MRRKRVAIFGSTGSIGRAALEVVAHLSDRLELWAIAAHRSAGPISAQARRFQPRFVILTDPAAARKVSAHCRVLSGLDSLIALARSPRTDILVMAMSGTAGLLPVIAALEHGKQVAIATKEILVSFGEPVMQAAHSHGGTVLPIDSELAALHQCLNGRDPTAIKRVILTASGGPFWRTGLPAQATVARCSAIPPGQWARRLRLTPPR